MRFITRRLRIQRLVCPHIHRSNRHRQAVHTFHSLAIGKVLLLLIGQPASAPHKEEFTAEQSYPNSSRLQSCHGVFRALNVCQQVNLLPIFGDRDGVLDPLELLALQYCDLLSITILRQDCRRGIHHNHASIAIDDDHIVLADQLTGCTRAHHSRHIHASRNDGCMAGFTAYISDKARKH